MLWWNIIAISILAALAVASDSKSATDDAQNNIMHHTRELFGLNQVRTSVTCVPHHSIYITVILIELLCSQISPLAPQQ